MKVKYLVTLTLVMLCVNSFALSLDDLNEEQRKVYNEEINKIKVTENDRLIYKDYNFYLPNIKFNIFSSLGKLYKDEVINFGKFCKAAGPDVFEKYLIYKKNIFKDNNELRIYIRRKKFSSSYLYNDAEKKAFEKKLLLIKTLSKALVKLFNEKIKNSAVARERLTKTYRELKSGEIVKIAYYHNRKMLFLGVYSFFGTNGSPSSNPMNSSISPGITLMYFFKEPYNDVNFGISFNIGYEYIKARFGGSSDETTSINFGNLDFSIDFVFKYKILLAHIGPLISLKVNGPDKFTALSYQYEAKSFGFGLDFGVGIILTPENINYAFFISFSSKFLFKTYIEKLNTGKKDMGEVYFGIKLGFLFNIS